MADIRSMIGNDFRPTLAHLIGSVANKWNTLEYNLTPLTSALMGADESVARITLNALTPVAKRDYLYALIYEGPWEKLNLATELNAFVKEYDRLRDQRNDIVHGRWSLTIKDSQLVPIWSMLKGKSKPKEHIDSKDEEFILKIYTEIEALQLSLIFLTVRVKEAARNIRR